MKYLHYRHLFCFLLYDETINSSSSDDPILSLPDRYLSCLDSLSLLGSRGVVASC